VGWGRCEISFVSEKGAWTGAQLHMYLCLTVSKLTTKNRVVFDDIHIYHLAFFVILTTQRE